MQDVLKKAGEKVIDYIIPGACAAVLLWFGRLPENIREAVPFLAVAAIALCSIIQSGRTRSEIGKLRKIHEESDRTSDLMSEAMRAQMDDAMGKLYAGCVQRGYSTEDERRCYERMERAYEGIGGNGEAKRRASKFFALRTEEEWKAAK